MRYYFQIKENDEYNTNTLVKSRKNWNQYVPRVLKNLDLEPQMKDNCQWSRDFFKRVLGKIHNYSQIKRNE